MITEYLKNKIIHRRLYCYDRTFDSLSFTCGNVFLYEYKSEKSNNAKYNNTTIKKNDNRYKWYRSNINGNIFLYTTTSYPSFRLLIPTKSSSFNFKLELFNFTIDFVRNFIILKIQNKIFGFWTPDQTDLENLYSNFEQILIETNQ